MAVRRISRQFSDRLLSLFTPPGQALYRFRCRSFVCGWQGCLQMTEHDEELLYDDVMPAPPQGHHSRGAVPPAN
jgi:hypothetical protein